MKRLVLDPNVLVSGIPRQERATPPRLLVDAIENQTFEAMFCPHLLGEIRKTLRKPYFRKRLEDTAAENALAMLASAGSMLADPTQIEPLLRDPDDDYLVALAREAGAEAIISGDKDLLDHPGLEPPALDARSACQLLGLLA